MSLTNEQIMSYINSNSVEDYENKLRSKDPIGLSDRIALLDEAKHLFQSKIALSEMTIFERSIFLGQTKKDGGYPFEINHFGAPKGLGKVQALVAKDFSLLDDFFAAIPRNKLINDVQYFKLIELFKQACHKAQFGNLFPFALFTRILSITRPDTFVPAAAGTVNKLCRMFKLIDKIKISLINTDPVRYWQEFLPLLHNKSLFEKGVGDTSMRGIALLDCALWEAKNKNTQVRFKKPSVSLETEQNIHKSFISATSIPLNQILYGPPGTGKTYHTVEAAVRAANPYFEWDNDRDRDRDRDKLKREYDDLVSNKRIRFITFHQSYGYEEFVEGLRANSKGESISYDVEAGVFKSICDDADANTPTNILNIGDSFDGFKIEDINNQSIIFSKDNRDPIVLLKKSINNIFKYFKFRQKLYLLEPNEWLNNFDNILKEYFVIDDPSLYKNVINDMQSKLDEMSLQDEQSNYVLIIDEINRGNISKIFGELITLIEPSKREGEKESLAVTLPLSSEVFSVPNNLYIIGTMNTADRSLAMMDTALRRRFDFIEMLPDYTILRNEPLIVRESKIEIVSILQKMNERIEVLYDREHTLGHAFFIPIRDYIDEGENEKAFSVLKSVFKNKIIPLLEEYFFDDWNKIRLVLGDNKKDEELRFITTNTNSYDNIFGSDHGLDSYETEIQTYSLKPFDNSVWNDPQAYIGIYKKDSLLDNNNQG